MVRISYTKVLLLFKTALHICVPGMSSVAFCAPFVYGQAGFVETALCFPSFSLLLCFGLRWAGREGKMCLGRLFELLF